MVSLPSQNKNKLAILKSRGQNFLIDKAVVKKLVGAADLQSGETVLEIGPGEGALTDLLAQKAGRVVAVEIDRGRAQSLSERYKNSNVEVFHRDILKVDLAALGLSDRQFVVVANLPFNIGTAVIKKLLTGPVKPLKIVGVLQQEVVDRIINRNGKETLLSLSVKLYGRAQKLFEISRNSYRPRPRVETAVLAIDLNKDTLPSKTIEAEIWVLLRAGFAAKRKKLAGNLSRGLNLSASVVEAALRRIGLDSQIRAEDLTLTDWLSLQKALNNG